MSERPVGRESRCAEGHATGKLARKEEKVMEVARLGRRAQRGGGCGGGQGQLRGLEWGGELIPLLSTSVVI
jgi:hypothetical protein